MPEPPAPPPITFEQALAELEKVVEDLEAGGLSLDESLGRYELGVRRLAECRRILESVEARVEVLRRAADGSPATEPFDPRPARGNGG
jgi:exodeoxyribonuclease VII small subunit